MSVDTVNHVFDVIMAVLAIASAAVPLAQKIASMTASKTDDELVEKVATFIHDALAFLPTLRLGPTLAQKQTMGPSTPQKDPKNA